MADSHLLLILCATVNVVMLRRLSSSQISSLGHHNRVPIDYLENPRIFLPTIDTKSPLKFSGSSSDPNYRQSSVLPLLQDIPPTAHIPMPQTFPAITATDLIPRPHLSLTSLMAESAMRTSRVRASLLTSPSTYPLNRAWMPKGFRRQCGIKLRHFCDSSLEEGEGRGLDNQWVRPRLQVLVVQIASLKPLENGCHPLLLDPR